MIVCRDKILAKVLEVFVMPRAAEEYLKAVAQMDANIASAARELGG